MAERSGKSGTRKVGLTSEGGAAVRSEKRAEANPVPAIPPAGDVPATCAMLRSLRAEVFVRIDLVEHALRGEIKSARADLSKDIHNVRAELSGEIHGVKSQLHTLQTGVLGLQADMRRMLFLMEEQNARNQVVLEGLASSAARHDRTEKRVDALEETIRSLASGHRPGG